MFKQEKTVLKSKLNSGCGGKFMSQGNNSTVLQLELNYAQACTCKDVFVFDH